MRFGWQVFALGLAFCTLWSSAFTVGKFAVQVAPPLTFLAIRFGIAFLVMWAVLTVMKRGLPKDRKDLWTAIWLGILNNAAYLGLCFIAFRTTSSSMVALIASLMPLVTAALAWPVLGEGLTLRKIAGLVLGTAGAWYILWNRLGGDLQVDDPFGFGIATIGMICLACGTVLYKKRGAHADPLAMNAVQALSASVVLIPTAFLLEDVTAITFGWTFIWTQAYTAIIMTFGALLLWFALIRQAGAAAASTFHFLNPGIAMLIAWLALNETITVPDVTGLIPVAVGILMVNWPSGKKKAQAIA
ncbi:EamA family transporter [Rhodospirillaceae bacterium KN72]|uniref:EamA family transporter n=1 Tax=Pacificispira spongiicola TaxID=2729598 RepID=A0A7Y0E1U9_9PROT|nr:DMT family transporter [Pacificispira spongiicola]NMM44896.1 EamA family transporter [Pacificispira spongiicola]